MDIGEKRPTGAAENCLHGDTVDVLAATTKSLVAIGAAAALNCHICLRHLIPAALNSGILVEEVTAALVVAREVRARVGGLTDDLGDTLVQRGAAVAAGGAGPTKCC